MDDLRCRAVMDMYSRLIRINFLIAGLVFTVPLSGVEGQSTEDQTTARTLLRTADVSGGIIAHLNCGDGRLTAALRENSRYVVQGLGGESGDVAAARQYIRSSGNYGSVSVRYWTRNSLPYADSLLNLVVLSPGECQPSEEELMRVLAPRGVLLTRGPGSGTQPSGLPGWWMAVKAVPSDIDDWTHYLHDSGNNAVAHDLRVGPPEHLRWKARPMWCRSHEFASSVHTLISSAGRLIGVIDEGIIGQPRGVPTFWTLTARDAFNGTLLWKRPIAKINPHALVAAGDRVYVTMDSRGPLSVLDAATGETVKTYSQTGRVNEIAFCDGRVILSSVLKGKAEAESGPHLVAVDPETGEILWKVQVDRIEGNTMVADAGRVCCFDGKELLCFELATGSEIWRASAKIGRKGYAVMYRGMVFLTGAGTRAFSLETGKQLWDGPNASGHARNPPGLFGADGLMWCAWEGSRHGRSFLWQPEVETRNGYDPVSGEIKRTVTVDRLVTAGHHIRCYPPKATDRFLLLNKRGVEFFDLVGDDHMRANWTRGACGFGILPANGLLYTPPSQCFCYPGAKLDGFNALAAAAETSSDGENYLNDDARLFKGPAYGSASVVDLAADSAAWPTYRHDARRSGVTESPLPKELNRRWEISLCDTDFGLDASAPKDEMDRSDEEPGVVLRWTDATVHGKGAAKGSTCIQSWRGADTFVTWEARIHSPGRQHVWVLQSNKGQGGSLFELTIGDEKVTGQIHHTNDWDDFVWIDAGEIDIPAPGSYTVRIMPVKQVEGRLGNVRAVAVGEAPPAGNRIDDQDDLLRKYPRGGISPPVAAGKRIFVAEPDAHHIHCLDADQGMTLWSFAADARVDSPPTIFKGLVLFGSTDGRVYCLRASDGVLVWRFTAAPRERQISIFNQLESVWPVHGSVLVKDGAVYFTAGRSSFIDGGIYLYALEPETGKVLHTRRLVNTRPDVSKYGGRPFDMEGAKSDILVGGENHIHMFQKSFNNRLEPQVTPRITKLGDRRKEAHLMTTDGFLDTTWFNRTYWSYGERWPGYYFTYRGPKSGQILVFNDTATYALKVFTHRRGHSPEFTPGEGYLLYADQNTTRPVLDAMDIGAEKGRGFSRTVLPIWSKRIPIRVKAMFLAGESLCVAGPPDLAPEKDAYEAMTGRKGSLVRTVDTRDGETLAEFKIKETPVFDGLIAANGRVYMSTMDGKIICFGK